MSPQKYYVFIIRDFALTNYSLFDSQEHKHNDNSNSENKIQIFIYVFKI